jgi:hypothetical protein
MATEKLLAGPRLRRLRQQLGLTQTRMAEELGISTSYLNLIERNQRPISAQLLLKLVDIYDVDLSKFGGGGDARLTAEVYEALRDPLFRGRGEGVSKTEVEDVVNASPGLATALLRLYGDMRNSAQRASALTEKLADRDKVELYDEAASAVEEVRAFIHASNNYFPELDEAAELMAKELRLDSGNIYEALVHRLKEQHYLSVRIVPADVMSEMLRYFDLHSRRVNLSELLDESGRRFQLAFQLGMLEQRNIIDRTIEEAGLKSEEALRLARVTLANYFAAAMLMPYGQFLREAEGSKYDIELLTHRFGTSYEQVAHRLTTLQRPGAKGVSFFFVRIDIAGNVSKRFSSGSFHFSKFGGACPLWNIHECFQTPNKIHTQIVQLPDETTYFSIARTVTRAGGAYSRPAQQLAVGLGCDIRQASRLVYAAPYKLETPEPTPIGINCYMCERPNCQQRAFAPLNRQLRFDERARGASMYQFVHDE